MFSKVFVFIALFGLAVVDLSIGDAPQPYKFGYNIKDKHGDQYREETGDGHSSVKGSYGFTDDRGVKRQVDYVADHAGFRAQVKTNEPGTANQNPAAVKMISDAPYAGGVALGGIGYGLGGLGAGDLGGVGAGGLGGVGAGGLGGVGAGGLGGVGLGYEGLGYGLNAGGLGGLGYGIGASGMGGLGYGLNAGGMGGLGYGLNAGGIGGLGYGGYGLNAGGLGGLGYGGYGLGARGMGGFGYGGYGGLGLGILGGLGYARYGY